MHIGRALIRGFSSAAATLRRTSSSRNSAVILRRCPSVYPNLMNSSSSIFFSLSMATENQSSSQQSPQWEESSEWEVKRKPLLMLSSPATPEVHHLYDITDHCFHGMLHLHSIAGRHCIGSSQGFIISIDRVTRDVIVVNPLTGAHLSFPSAANVSPDFFTCQPNDRGKAILSPSLDVMVGVCANGLIFAASGDSSWTRLPTRLSMYDDCIFHEGLLHSINYCGEMEIHDLNHPKTPPFILKPGPIKSDANYSKFLVESPVGGGNNLFIVSRGKPFDPAGCPPEPTVDPTVDPETLATFQVFQLNKDDYRWHDVKSLDNGSLAVFVGSNHSFAVRASDFSGIKANSIYFTRKPVVGHDGAWDEDIDLVHFIGVFDLGEGCMEFYQMINHIRNYYCPPPIWFMPSKIPS